MITAMAGFTSGMMDKFMNDMLENTAHAKIFLKGYYQKQEIAPLELSIPDYTAIIKKLKSKTPDLLTSAGISAGAVVSCGTNSLNLMCQGIAPFSGKDDKELFPMYGVYQRSVIAGNFFTGNGQTGVLISRYAAENLQCSLNDRIILFTSDSYGSFNAVELPVIGIFQTGYRDRDENICLADLASIQRLTGLEDRASEISLVFQDIREADAFLKQDEGILRKHNLEYFTWKELLGTYLYLVDAGNQFSYAIYIIFIIVAVVGIMNSVLISVFDRIRDIGTLRAIGFTKNDVSFMVFSELAVIGFAASLIGTALGGLLIYYFSVHGIPISESTKDVMNNFTNTNMIYTAFKWVYLVIPFLVSFLVPVLSALYPVSIMRKIKIKEALGYL